MIANTIRLASKAELVDLRADDSRQQITMSLLGNRGELSALESLARDVLKQHHWQFTCESGKTGAYFGRNLYYLTLNIDNPEGAISPAEVLEAIHRKSCCDLNASVKAKFYTYDRNLKNGSTQTYFVPRVEIAITQQCEETSDHIRQYLHKRLEEQFRNAHEQKPWDNPMLPHEFCPERGLAECTQGNIMLNFTQRATTYGHSAKMDANMLAEHLSGALGIREARPPEARKGVPNH